MDIFTTMITPYKSNGGIDYDMAEKYVEWYYENGLTGIFAVCQSSEIFYLSLEERTQLNRRVYKKAKELEAKGHRKFTVVSSGHISDDIDGQIAELNAVYESGTDALILITNRLDPNNEGDDVFIKNAERVIAGLPADAKLGFYECPYPYKRLVTPKILDWCLSTGRFYYMKDTCCDLAALNSRSAQLKGSNFKLLNANCQTLFDSMKNGCEGYCGIMCNFHPALYKKFFDQFEAGDEKAAVTSALIGTLGFIEGGVPYPLSAKYNMCLEGMESALIARNRPGETLTDYQKHCVEQLKLLSDNAIKEN